MRWPPQSPWRHLAARGVPFIHRQRSPWAREALVAGDPVSPACGRGEAALGSGEGSRPIASQNPRPDFRLAFPHPRVGFPLPPLPSRPFSLLPSSLFLPSLRPSPSPPPAPQQSGKVKRKGFRRIFIKPSLLRGITNRIKGGRDPAPLLGRYLITGSEGPSGDQGSSWTESCPFPGEPGPWRTPAPSLPVRLDRSAGPTEGAAASAPGQRRWPRRSSAQRPRGSKASAPRM